MIDAILSKTILNENSYSLSGKICGVIGSFYFSLYAFNACTNICKKYNIDNGFIFNHITDMCSCVVGSLFGFFIGFIFGMAYPITFPIAIAYIIKKYI